MKRMQARNNEEDTQELSAFNLGLIIGEMLFLVCFFSTNNNLVQRVEQKITNTQ